MLLCVPPAPASRLLAATHPRPRPCWRGRDGLVAAVVTLAVERAGLGALPGSGFLVPPVEGRTIKASTFSANKWAWTGALSDEVVHLRASVGRAREEAVLQRDDADLVAVSVAEVGRGARPPPDPGRRRARAALGWGLPQYAVGHVDAVATVRADVRACPVSRWRGRPTTASASPRSSRRRAVRPARPSSTSP